MSLKKGIDLGPQMTSLQSARRSASPKAGPDYPVSDQAGGRILQLGSPSLCVHVPQKQHHIYEHTGMASRKLRVLSLGTFPV